MDKKKFTQIHYNLNDLEDISVVKEVMQDAADSENVYMDDLEDMPVYLADNVKKMMNRNEEDLVAQCGEETVQNNSEKVDVPEENEKDYSVFHEMIEKMEKDINCINHELRRIEKKFECEILNSDNRDNAVKTMYKELNEYKEGIVEKALKNVLYDFADLREMMLSQAKYFREKKNEDVISLDELESYAEDIADLLEKYDVVIYKSEPGEENVAVRQKIVRKVITEDESQIKKVAESLSYGYEYNNKILYPEKISIFVKKN